MTQTIKDENQDFHDPLVFETHLKTLDQFSLNEELIRVAGCGDLPMTRICVSCGADATHQSIESESTALIRACAGNFPEVVKYLISLSPINATNDCGETAAHLCFYNGSIECLQLLIKAKADLSIVDENGCCVLFLAVQFGKKSWGRPDRCNDDFAKCLQLLLDFNDLLVADSNKPTLAQIAEEHDFQALTDYLRAKEEQSILTQSTPKALHNSLNSPDQTKRL